MQKRIAILGATKGIGRALVQTTLSQGHQVLACGRTAALLGELSSMDNVEAFQWDASREELLWPLMDSLNSFKADSIIYCAGGGPHGNFASKEWKDHQWAMSVCFETPARLIHSWLLGQLASVSQLICVGSAIAEDTPDTQASSYAAAKHALKGLVTSVQGETEKDLRLFSPGYVDTALLPPNARPRQQSVALLTPEEVANKLWDWAQQPTENPHLIYKPQP